MSTASRLTGRLLRRNISAGRGVGFVISNFIGLLIVCGALQAYMDARVLLDDEESFVRTDYLVVNKTVSSAGTLGLEKTSFSEAEIADLEKQPWARAVGRFTPADFRVEGAVDAGGRGMRTALFFESIPDRFVDVPSSSWQWHEGDSEVPIIISKDYLTLYNFGFATAAGLPRMSEGMMSGIPLRLCLGDSPESGMSLAGRVVGYSTRLNTILVPQSFIDAANARLGSGGTPEVSRLIIDVSSPGDAAIAKYLDGHGMEQAGDRDAASSTFLLRTVTGVVMAVGFLVTVLSFFILLLSVSLLMEKNRDRIHTLLLLGCPLRLAGRPYRLFVIAGCVAAFVLTAVSLLLLRSLYMPALSTFGAGGTGVVWGLGADLLMTLAIVAGNLVAISRRVKASWRPGR